MAASRVRKESVVVAEVALIATLLALLTTAAKPAQAAFPGSNGAFTSNQDGDLEIHRMAPDGFG